VSKSDPLISVVVATRNRRERAVRLLNTLSAQSEAPPFEVIMVDDASSDGTWEAISSWSPTGSFAFRPIRLDAREGPGEARNRGWREARAPVVAFTDDDCVPSPQWLRAIYEPTDRNDIVQGATHPDPERISLAGPWTELVNLPFGSPFCETCNVAYKRKLLEQLGGFDATFRFAGEDVDLATRALGSGAVYSFSAAAIVIHDVNRWSPRERFSRVMERLDDAPRTLARHPGLRKTLYHRLWFRPAHESAAAAGLGLVLMALSRRRLWRMLVLALFLAPYIRFRFGPGRLDNSFLINVRLLPVALAIDLTEVALLARGSWRHRTLML
jgi:glycosyltransferase involved in cell wall biosynthesis